MASGDEQGPVIVDRSGPAASFADLLARLFVESGRADVALRQGLGISTTEYLLLRVLLCDGPTTSADLCRAVGVTSASMVAMSRRLVDAGFVERIAHPTDKRRILLYATKLAATSIETATSATTARINDIGSHLARDCSTQVRQFLVDAAETMRDPDRAPV